MADGATRLKSDGVREVALTIAARALMYAIEGDEKRVEFSVDEKERAEKVSIFVAQELLTKYPALGEMFAFAKQIAGDMWEREVHCADGQYSS